MVSYFPTMYPKNHGSNLPYAGSWYPANYHHPPNHQFLSESEMTPHQAMYYNQHLFHQASPDWSSHEASLLQASVNPNLHLNQHTGHSTGEHMHDGLTAIPSPPTTVSGSEMSSPGVPNGSASPHVTPRPTPVKSPYEWMKKPSYQNQPHTGK